MSEGARIELDRHEDFVRHRKFASQSFCAGPHESESRVELRVANHDHRRIPMLATVIQASSDQLTANTRSLMVWTHRHRCETRDAHVGRRLHGDRRKQNMADDASIDRRDKRYGLGRASQPIDERGFCRGTEGLDVRFPNARLVVGKFKADLDVCHCGWFTLAARTSWQVKYDSRREYQYSDNRRPNSRNEHRTGGHVLRLFGNRMKVG